ncbi:hypothetical protein [Haladaptatus sp. DFWS20]|uniref:hypothetical protein n=1 Tax=Haladaptatus sp. DFWS20 TaxID=3403467 RepID=UPI003EC1383E
MNVVVASPAVMNRIATLLLVLAVVGVVLSGTVSAEETDRRGQYAEANLSHFKLDSQFNATSQDAVGEVSDGSLPLPPVVSIENPTDTVTAFGVSCSHVITTDAGDI